MSQERFSDKLLKVEKVTDAGMFLVGGVMVATGIPALVAFGGAAAVYSGTQYFAAERMFGKKK